MITVDMYLFKFIQNLDYNGKRVFVNLLDIAIWPSPRTIVKRVSIVFTWNDDSQTLTKFQTRIRFENVKRSVSYAGARFARLETAITISSSE